MRWPVGSTPAGHALRPRIVTSRSCCLYALGGQGRVSFGGVAEPYVFGALRVAMLTLLTFGFGAAVALSLLALPWRVSTRIIFRWDAGVVLYIALIYLVMAQGSIAKIRRRAAINDEGAIALLVLTAAASLASLASVLAELEQIEGAEDCGVARPLPADKIEHRKSVLVGDDRFAVDKARARR
jgi:Protein of unknown function (DUF1345)